MAGEWTQHQQLRPVRLQDLRQLLRFVGCNLVQCPRLSLRLQNLVRSPPTPSSEQSLMPDMSGVPSSASWGRDLSYCHGAPAQLDLTRSSAPAGVQVLPASSQAQTRTISSKLANKGFVLNGFCLLRCSESFGFSCSRPVAFGTRRGHANHQCPTCHPPVVCCVFSGCSSAQAYRLFQVPAP